jgi:signal transduction histidine kinase
MLRVTQEALANVAKHAQASHVLVTIERENKLVRLSVTDDGVGFDLATLTMPATDGRGWGIMSMTERTEAMGGHFQIKTRPLQGTQITVEVPL